MHVTNHRPPPVHDWTYDDWGDDCPVPYRERSPSVAALPHPRVDAPKSPPCTPRFGLNTNWAGNTCAKLHASEPSCDLRLGINRNWLDGKCTKLHESAAQAASEPTTPPVGAPPCTLNLGVNRNWLDSRCAKLHESVPQTGQDIGTTSLRDFFSSVVAPIDLRAYRANVANWTFDVILVVAAVFVALVFARLVSWMFNERSRRAEREDGSDLSPLPPEPFTEDVPGRYGPFDRRPQQDQEFRVRANELQTSLFGRP
jgi:hypothetical protein